MVVDALGVRVRCRIQFHTFCESNFCFRTLVPAFL